MREPIEPLIDSHEHEWVFAYTYSDWWDGDEEDVYECATEGCKAQRRAYAPR